jgi:hypothetical protein
MWYRGTSELTKAELKTETNGCYFIHQSVELVNCLNVEQLHAAFATSRSLHPVSCTSCHELRCATNVVLSTVSRRNVIVKNSSQVC